jgi:SPP1 family predicted phage head-tail adaptor
MRAGQLRHRITIQSRTTTVDSSGGTSDTWATFLQANAEIKTQTGREGLVADMPQTESTMVVRMRFQPGITTDMRVLYHARTLDINYIDNVIENDAELLLYCRES